MKRRKKTTADKTDNTTNILAKEGRVKRYQEREREREREREKSNTNKTGPSKITKDDSTNALAKNTKNQSSRNF